MWLLDLGIIWTLPENLRTCSPGHTFFSSQKQQSTCQAIFQVNSADRWVSEPPRVMGVALGTGGQTQAPEKSTTDNRSSNSSAYNHRLWSSRWEILRHPKPTNKKTWAACLSQRLWASSRAILIRAGFPGRLRSPPSDRKRTPAAIL